MAIELACFTERGFALGERLLRLLGGPGRPAALTRCGKGGPTAGEWARARFHAADALIFIGATGIAVRSIAGELTDKLHDPAVVVVDDQGQFAIALLSGHVGGANALARRVAALLGAVPVVTTATDGAGLFAIDSWAAENGLVIANPGGIKSISAKLLSGETVTFHSAFPVGTPPPGLRPAAAGSDLRIDVRRPSDPDALWLIPPAVVLGLGCRRGTAAAAIGRAVGELCRRENIAPEAIAKVCSIDLKEDEPGILEFCRRRNLPFQTFSGAELARAEGEFSSSAFVGAAAGVESVCDRAVVCGGGGPLTGKTVIDGIALALGVLPYTVPFPANEEN